MLDQFNTTAPRFYAACLASYNNGELHGVWIDASADTDDMAAPIAAMLRASRFPNVTVQCVDCDGHGIAAGAAFADSTPCPTCKGFGSVASAEEWAIHDREGLGDIGEYAGLDGIAARIELIDLADEIGLPAAVAMEFASDRRTGDELTGDELKDALQDAYVGSAESWKDFVQEQVEATHDMTSVPDWLEYHIDWDSMARDWEVSGDYNAYRDGGDLYFFTSH
jgi:antirestriction protein